MKYNNVRYCLMEVSINHEDRNPQIVMKDLGITYQCSTPQSMGDQWWFWNCSNLPEKLPSYLTLLDINPMECIGYGLSKEEAESIRDWNKKPEKSYIENCLIVPSKKDKGKELFIETDNGFMSRLDGYAIIPIEMYNDLKEDQNTLDASTDIPSNINNEY